MAAARAMEPGCMSRSVHCAGSTVANGSGRQPWSSANSLSLRESPLCQSLVRNRRSHDCRVVSVATKEGDAETESSQMVSNAILMHVVAFLFTYPHEARSAMSEFIF
jgi:hypothetical protein